MSDNTPDRLKSSVRQRANGGRAGNGAALEQPPAIEVRGLRTAFGPAVIHDDLELEVYRGEVLAVVGGSGTGKSVLLREIIGLMKPSAGTIRLFGEEMTSVGDKKRSEMRGRIGVLFQDGALFSSLTVTQNIQLPLRERHKLSERLLCELAGVKLALTGLPADAGRKYPSELSGGMRKRAGLARALALDPEILFLDEPTAGLDPIGANAFDELIHSLRNSLGLTVVMITHDLDSLYKITDRVAVLVDKKARTGSTRELESSDHPWIRSYFKGERGRAAQSAATASAAGEARAADAPSTPADTAKEH